MRDIPEHIIISKLKNGEEAAYKLLFKNYYPLMCSIAMSYVNDAGACEALANDIIFRIWEHRETFEIHTSLKGYLMRAARNGALDHLRARKVNPLSGVNSIPIEGGGMPVSERSPLFIADADLFEELIATDLGRKIEQLIRELPDDSRNIFCLSRFKNLSYEEIANRQGISVNTVKYHIKNALKILRGELKEFLAIWPFFL